MSIRRGGFVALPMEGEIAAPDIAMAAGRVMSRRRLAPRRRSYSFVATAPTSGPPIASRLNVKLDTPRPGGVAPGSEMLAAAHTSSVGQPSPLGPGHTPDSDSGTSVLKSRSTAFCRGAPAGAPSSTTRFSANAVHSRRR